MRLLALSLTALFLSTVPCAALEREIEATFPAAGLEAVELSTGDGQVEIATSSDDQIRIRLALSPRRGAKRSGASRIKSWFFTPRLDQQELLDQVELKTKRSGDRLVVTPRPGGTAREDLLSEHWVIELPARLAVSLEADSSEVSVRGVTGGVRVRQGHGHLEVDVPEGDLDLRLDVGDVEVASQAAQVGTVDVRSTVGDTRVWLRDRRVRVERPPGPGSSFRLRGGVGDEVKVRVTVGNAVLRLPN